MALFFGEMYLYLWFLFVLNLLFSAGIMLTYISRGKNGNGTSSMEGGEKEGARALVILPAKGLDLELDENLASLRNQGYASYDLIAVVDSKGDESVPMLEKENIGYTVADADCVNCSGKVRAIYSALSKFPDYDRYVVADSDIRAKHTWLEDLLLPLSDSNVGVSTTFPIFYPRGGFWSKFKMFWGLVGQSMMESNLTKFVWGGSMAFRRDLLDVESLKLFSESVSDDIAVLRIAKGKGFQISYVPEARPMIYSRENFNQFMEWSNRQTAFSIYSTNKTFSFGMVYYMVSIYLIISSIVLGVLSDALFLVFLFPYAFNSVNSLRKVPVKVWYFPVFTLILPFVYVWNLMSGMVRKEVVWRGRNYSLARD